MPAPIETELRVQDSPVPTQMVLEFCGSNAMAPIDWTGCLSKTGLKVVPPSVDFHTPPEAAPTKTVGVPFSFRAAVAAMRPLLAGGRGRPLVGCRDDPTHHARAAGRELEHAVRHRHVGLRPLDRQAKRFRRAGV